MVLWTAAAAGLQRVVQLCVHQLPENSPVSMQELHTLGWDLSPQCSILSAVAAAATVQVQVYKVTRYIIFTSVVYDCTVKTVHSSAAVCSKSSRKCRALQLKQNYMNGCEM